jgi:predicted transcriptional regulator
MGIISAKIKAFKEYNESGKRISCRNRILNFIIKRGEVTMFQVESLLNIKHQTASARMSELEDNGEIYVSGTYNDGKSSKWKHEHNIAKQKENALKRTKIKYEAWLKEGEINNWKQI